MANERHDYYENERFPDYQGQLGGLGYLTVTTTPEVIGGGVY